MKGSCVIDRLKYPELFQDYVMSLVTNIKESVNYIEVISSEQQDKWKIEMDQKISAFHETKLGI